MRMCSIQLKLCRVCSAACRMGLFDRSYVVNQWIKNSHSRYRGLRTLGVSAKGATASPSSDKAPGLFTTQSRSKWCCQTVFLPRKVSFPPPGTTGFYDDKNRCVRIRTHGSMGGRSCEAFPYPASIFLRIRSL